VLYTSPGILSLALIEVLSNLRGNPRLFPDSYQFMKITVSDQVTTDVLEPNRLLRNWRDDISQTQSLGDAWLAGGNFALLGVPSVPSPESVNYLLNPLLPDAKGLEIEWCKWITSDCFT
jgi:hypothetical protein